MRITRRVAALAAITASAITAAGCGSPGHKPPVPRRPSAVLTASQVSALRAYGSGDTAFGLKVLSELCSARPGRNEVISPVSLATGLGMTYLGARGSTASAMGRVLHLPAAGPGLVSGLAARAALLRSLNRPGVTFTTSNRIWADPSLTTHASFLRELRAGFQAGLTHLPLLTNPDLSRARINAAIARDTRGHIENLIRPGSLVNIGWVLTDALYLNARWKHPFNAALTSPGSFSTGHGKVTAKFMTGNSFPVATADGWTVASLPYKGGRLSMLAMLPPAGGSGCQVPIAATVRSLSAAVAATGQSMGIILPKVNLSASESLQQVLTSLGMGIAFSGGADFSGISPQALRIGFVQHAATLHVDEKGTVASAATAVGVVASALEIKLDFDRPYLLMLRDSLTGEPLMLAWVANPAQR
jgi:serpin B